MLKSEKKNKKKIDRYLYLFQNSLVSKSWKRKKKKKDREIDRFSNFSRKRKKKEKKRKESTENVSEYRIYPWERELVGNN